MLTLAKRSTQNPRDVLWRKRRSSCQSFHFTEEDSRQWSLSVSAVPMLCDCVRSRHEIEQNHYLSVTTVRSPQPELPSDDELSIESTSSIPNRSDHELLPLLSNCGSLAAVGDETVVPPPSPGAQLLE